MRDFNDFEKGKIRQMIKTNPNKPCIGDFIADSILVDRVIYINRQTKTLSLIFPKGDDSAKTDFFDLLSLIEYLKNERLMFVHTNPSPFKGELLSKNGKYNKQTNSMTDSNGNTIIDSNRNLNPLYTKIDIPTTVFDLLIGYINEFYHPGGELKLLVENDFETLEKKQLKESLIQTKYSKMAFYIALIALIFTIVYSVFVKSNVKLDKKQYDDLIKSIEINDNKIKSNKELKTLLKQSLIPLIKHTKQKIIMHKYPTTI